MDEKLSVAAAESDVGIPASGEMDAGGDLSGRPGMHHWKQAEITDPGLEKRGGVFFAAVEMTRMPMILADPRQEDCPIVFANNAFLDLTGYEVDEVLGRNCRFLQGAQTDQESVGQLRTAIHTQTAVALEILNYRRDGTPFWNAVFMGPVFDHAGELLYFFASQLDVSARRQTEQLYRQAQKMEAIGQLTAGLAHDFNNLLHVIDGSLERIANKRDDDRVFERYVAAARSASERGAKLTHQLLAFARRTRLEPKGVDMTKLINSIAELLETSVGEHARLRLDLQRRLPTIKVDPTQLEMALLNIVVNARDASPKGGVIVVSTEEIQVNGPGDHHLEPGDYVRLSVVDMGHGMPAHIQARATEPFFTTKPKGQGTGLGLAMAHGFAQQSGGRLEIDSEAGRGTTISLIFPVMSGEEAEPTGPASHSYQPKVMESDAATPLILVVDDNVEIAALAEDALSDVGYRVVVAHSAEDALKRFDEARSQDADGGFRLVFTDVLMPGGDNGMVLASKLRERAPEIPVLLTTGYNDEMALNGPQDGASDVLGKPYKRSELIDRVQAALSRGPRTGPGRMTSDFGHVRA